MWLVSKSDAAKVIATIKGMIDNRVYTGAAPAIDIAGPAGDIWGGNMEVEDFEEVPKMFGNVCSR